ncbi:hypothetical protein Cantr_02837 [Candida viswanathii]|uniref:Uncharacterized protein n=1 Tax=Candida viswanathii TaxID=5486 RepID=A0A367YLX5_9ASCO|nr:hypothetical protein Cantr_02837 [Candida viswanathii]
MTRPAFSPPDNASTLIDRLNGLITATLTSATFTQAQRIELIKLFQITVNMISDKQHRSTNGQLPYGSVIQYTTLIDSFQNLISANRTSLIPVSNNLTPASTAPPTSRKYGIFQDRVSNISPPSISTNSVYDVEQNSLYTGNRTVSQPVDEEEDDSGSEFEEEEEGEDSDIYNNTSMLLPSPQRQPIHPGFPESRISEPAYQGRLIRPNRLNSLYSLQ